MKHRNPYCTMSTEKGRKKRKIARIERIKIIEYGCIALVILLFLVLAVIYGSKNYAGAGSKASASPTPEATADTSIRGKNVLDALDKSGFSVVFRSDHYDAVSPEDVPFTVCMLSDDDGLRLFSAETLLYPDPDDGTETAEMLREENRITVKAIRTLFDAVIPVFHRTVSYSNTIANQCQKVVKDGNPYVKQMGNFTVNISTVFRDGLQYVIVTLTRDP